MSEQTNQTERTLEMLQEMALAEHTIVITKAYPDEDGEDLNEFYLEVRYTPDHARPSKLIYDIQATDDLKGAIWDAYNWVFHPEDMRQEENPEEPWH